jgi:nucleoside-diphosphate-sugar epimerase
MYVDDCVDLILRASDAKDVGGVVNGGTGKDLAINDLARVIAGPDGRIEHVPHPHPQSEIRRLRCDPTKAAKLLGWQAKVSLEDGIARTREWMSR